MIINPLIIPKSPRIRKLKHIRRTTIRTPLTPRQLRIKQTHHPRIRIVPGPKILKLGLQSQSAAISRRHPVDIPRRQDRGVEIGAGEDRAHEAVPGAAKGAAVVDYRGDAAVGSGDGRVDDVGAVFVGEGGVDAFPGRDAAAAAAEGDLDVCCPESAEAWEALAVFVWDGKSRGRSGGACHRRNRFGRLLRRLS